MKRRGEEGQALVVVAGGLTVLLLAAGIGVDIGYLRYQKRCIQAAADSAAIAGAAEINYGDVTQAAQTDSATNGYTNGSNNVTVTVYNPPNDGPHAGVSGYVEVLVSKVQPTFFAKVAGFNNVTVTARAVAYAGSGQGCIYALAPTGTGVLMNGGTNITSQCGVYINSNSSQALLMNGTNTLDDRFTDIVGGDLLNGSNTTNPTPTTGIVASSDPLAYLDNSEPSISTPCSGGSTYPAINGTGANVTITPGSNCYSVTINGSNNTVTLNPGNYGSVTVNGTGNNVTLGAGIYGNVLINGSGTLTFGPGQYSSITGNGTPNEIFNPGLYVISSGNVILNGTNGMSGTGVTFYLGPNAGGITVNGSDTTSLSAPTSGTYAGILFFQNPSDTSNATFNGSNGTVWNGAIYLPKAQVTMNGSNSSSAQYTILVANNLVLNGTDTFNDNYSSLAQGSPIKTATLGE
ncbi:MAG TPA: pilus assembly protein TadG-related protein [Terriglobia bacterium]|nr:pilus assembly protein TadG-related protein [Terriglobia bacterium]